MRRCYCGLKGGAHSKRARYVRHHIIRRLTVQIVHISSLFDMVSLVISVVVYFSVGLLLSAVLIYHVVKPRMSNRMNESLEMYLPLGESPGHFLRHLPSRLVNGWYSCDGVCAPLRKRIVLGWHGCTMQPTR
jgi:hypothetical protein